MVEFVKPSLPRLDTALANQVEALEPMNERLVSAIADVLSITRNDIQLYDSFADLGGDGVSAARLSRSCSARGMALRDEDVLRCQTIAELQTCLKPIEQEKESEDEVSSPASETFSLAPRQSSELYDSCSSRSRASSDAKDSRNAVEMTQTEKLLTSTSQVPQAALVQPRAGYFEGKLVIFVTLSGTSSNEQGSPTCGVQLIPQSQHHFAGVQIAALRMLLENSTTITAMPTAWIILEQMPLNEAGACDRRKLQGWIQNMNEDVYQQVMSLESQELLQEPSTDMERSLQRILSRVLKLPLERIGMNFSFGQLGGDDISALQLIAACRAESICLTTDDVAQSDCIAHLAFLASWKGNAPARWDDECPEGFKLSPMQQLYFQTPVGGDYEARANHGRRYRFNQSMLLKINSTTPLEDVHAAVEAVVGHHSMLRSRFRAAKDGWMQNILTDIAESYRFGDHTVSTNDEVLDIIRQAQSFIDIETGPVFAVEHIRTMDGQQMMYIVAHHLVIDLISWRVIIHDLSELVQNGSLFSERAMPFQRWNELQEAEMQSLEHKAPLPFEPTAGDFEFWGVNAARNSYGDAVEVSFSLTPELTSILQTTCNQAFRSDSTDIYLAALLLSFCQTFPDRAPPVVWNQEHGREPWGPDIDIAETVGWFTTLCPLWLGMETNDDFIHVLRRIKDTRRSIPRRGWAYFASRFLGPDADNFQSQDWPFEIMFTYAGSLQQLEAENGVLEQLPIPGRTLDSDTSDIGPLVGRIALFEVSTMIDQGVATVKFLYNKRSKHQARILTWITNYEHLLLEAIGRLRYRSQELTLADVPLLQTNYEGLAKLNSDRLLALNITSARDIENVFPATPAQQEILITQSQSIDICHNHVIYEFVAPGTSLEPSRVCSAWQQIVAKYPALRTVFIESVSEDGLYDQVVLKKCSPDMLFIDAGPNDDPLLSLNTLPPLRSGGSEPRHRLSVCKTSTSAFLKLEISQALCDVASLEKLAGDLKRTYGNGKVPSRSLDFSYPEYIQSLKATQLSNSIDFWKVQLRESQPCIFPTLSSSGDGQSQPTSFQLETTAADMDNFCKAKGVRRSTILRLAWGLVLRAFTGSGRVCFGYRHSGRDAPFAPKGLDGAVGSFETTVICALDLWAHRSLESAVQAADEQLALYLPHQHTPVSEIQNALGLRGESLFNTCLSFHEEARGLQSRFSSTRAQQMQLPCVMSYNTSDHDISVSAMMRDGRLEVTLNHRILTTVQAENVAHVFSCAIKAVVKSPNGSIGGVDLFSDRDYAQLPVSNSADELAKPEMAIHQMIGQMALARPEAQAVCGWDGKLSYKQLVKLVSRLSHYLVDLGVEPGLAVPVVLGKSCWSAVAILAVLKAGGCFIPVDEEDGHFAEVVVKQVKAKIVLATDMQAKRFEGLVESVVIVNETLFAAILPSETRCPKPRPTDAACMMFTPGSGRSREARGIFFTHEALCAALHAQGESLMMDRDSRVLQLSSFTSDTALAETLTTLVSGGCVCVPAASERLADFAGAVNRMQVNWTYFTPVLARRLHASSMPSLETVCFRTRRLDEDTYMRWAQKTRILLSYGAPDICPLGISVMEVSCADQLSRIAPPFIGKFWIVNPEDHRRLMPIGTIGELVIESPTLAYKLMRNHTPRATLQAQQVGSSSGGGNDDNGSGCGVFKTRFFKTGHRVRYMDDGTMEFVTTTRDDITMNGKVVPVPTVEQHLRRCLGQGIDVAVEAVTTRDSVLVLSAFIELGDLMDGPDDLALLTATTKERAYMAKRLVEASMQTSVPQHMIPDVFIPVRRLPITSSLKVNRRKLQKMVSGLDEAQLRRLAAVPSPDNFNAPGVKPLPLTQVEERMRGIWARILDVEPRTIPATQSFLRLGGDAHLVARLVVACRKEGLIISVRDVLENLTLTELCQSITLSEECFIEGALGLPDVAGPLPAELLADMDYVAKVIAPQVGIDTAAIADMAEATASQIRSLESGLRTSRTNVNYFVFSFAGFVDYKKLESACQTLARVHPILRTSFVTHNRNVFQVINDGYAPEFHRYQCPGWRLSGLEEKVVRKDSATVLNLSVPITRFFFLDAGKQSTLIVRLSTALYDDASLPLLLQDLKRIYSGAQNAPCRPSYTEFARCARLANAHGAAVDHWASLLQGASMTQVVAQTKPQQPTANARTLQQSIRVSTAALSELGISFDTVLKAAWSVVLATLAGTPDVVFGELVDGRHVRVPSAHGVSAVVGPVANVIPVRVRFPDAPSTPLELLQKVHAQRVASIPFENMGMLELVEKCTNWPYWSQFSTVVQHRYRDGLGDAARFNIGGATCHFRVLESGCRDLYDIFVTSLQPRADSADIALTFCEHRVPVSFAEDALKMLCSAVAMLASSPLSDPLIHSSVDFARMTRQIPLPQLDFDTPASQHGHLLPEPHRAAVEKAISAAWASILDPRALGVPEPHVRSAAFYDLWGSLIPAAQMAMCLTRALPGLHLPGLEGIEISMEEVIENPCIGKQFELVARKMVGKTHRRKPPPVGITPHSPSVWGRGIRKIRGDKDKDKDGNKLSHSRSISTASGTSSDGNQSLTTCSQGSGSAVQNHSNHHHHQHHHHPAYPAHLAFSPVQELPSPAVSTSGIPPPPAESERREASDVVSPLSPLSPTDRGANKLNLMRKASHLMGKLRNSPTHSPVGVVSPTS